MDSVSETERSSSLMNSKQQIGTFVHKRKFRRTNDFIVDELPDVHNLHKKKRPRNSFMPKIDDVKLTSYPLSKATKQLSPIKTKILKNVKLNKQKLESRCIDKTNNRIQSLKLKKAKGIWTPVKNEENMKCDVYVRLIPLEKTNLLNEKQLKQLTGCKLKQSEDSTISLSNFYKPCRVILKRLTEEEIKFVLNQNNDTSFVSSRVFSPGVTSSPIIISDIADPQSTIIKTLFTNADTNLEGDASTSTSTNKTRDGTIIEINSTYEIDNNLLRTPINGVTKQVTWQDVSLGTTYNENINNSLNRTYEIDQRHDQKKTQTPKSVLKTNTRTPTNNNRRVTFNDTSVIIIHDHCSNTYMSSTPTHFTKDYNDSDSKRNKLIALAGRTPANISVLKNANSTPKKDLTPNVTSQKRTRMPDFAKIHKRMFDGMLDIKQHTEEKLKRSHLLLSGRKPNTRLLNEHIHSVTTHLKKQNTKKVLLDKPNSVGNPAIKKDKLDIKDKNKHSLFHKQRIALANKVRPNETSSRENNRVYIKGIRSNRRFELLMNLRKTQQKQDKK